MNELKLNSFRMLGIVRVAIISVALYILAMFVPITGFLLPVYKIRNMSLFNRMEWILINILIILMIGIVDVKSLGLYLIVFLMIEILYSIFKNIKFSFPVFDRIILSGIIITIISVFYLKLISDDILLIRQGIEEVYAKHYDIDPQKLSIIFKFMKDNLLLLVYSYVGFIIHMTYFSIDQKNYSSWRISYQWLLFYIVPFLMMRFLHVKNIYLLNIMTMAKITYVVYGIKIVYNFIRRKIKFDFISQVIAVIIGMNFLNFVFIIGGLQCFEFIKVVILKNNSGGR